MVAACMGVADYSLRLPEVRAFAHPANAGSQRVLEKAGFEVVRFLPELDRFLYRRVRRADHCLICRAYPATRNTAAAKRFLGKALNGLKDREKPVPTPTGRRPTPLPWRS